MTRSERVKKHPPIFSEKLLYFFLTPYTEMPALGDLEAEFYILCNESGYWKAGNWYRWQVIKSIPLMLRTFFYWSYVMFTNYMKVAVRNILKHKGFSLINISGLAVGMACCILILMWVQDELSYDRFHEKGDTIYRILREDFAEGTQIKSALSAPPFARGLKAEYPEISESSMFGSFGSWLVNYGDHSFSELKYECADPTFFSIFSFPFVKGSPETALSDMYSVVITEEMADKYFGNEDPIGKILTINTTFDVKVTGVIRNIPANSSLQFDFLSPFSLLIKEILGQNNEDNWGFNSFATFVMLSDKAGESLLGEKIKSFLREKIDVEEGDNLYIQPLLDIHLYSDAEHDFDGTGDDKYVYIFSAMAIFVILIACINFINMTTARSGNRAREVGMRKVVGACRKDIIRQFFGESILLSVFAALLALLLVAAVLPAFSNLAAKQLAFGTLAEPLFLGGILLIVLTTGLIAGGYPALYISSFQPVTVLKGSLSSGSKSSTLRKSLVVFQFSLSIMLIIGAVIISNQLKYMRNKDLGYDKESVIHIRMFGDSYSNYHPLKSELLRNLNVETVSACLALPADNGNSPGTPEYEGKAPDDEWDIRADFVDYDYFKTFKMEILQGRSFSKEYVTDDSAAYVVNEEAVRRMGMIEPLGKRFGFWNIPGNIVGVVKDFHFRPMRYEIEPIVYRIYTNLSWLRQVVVRIKPGNLNEAITSIEKDWKTINPEYPFDYKFLDETLAMLYETEQQLETLITYFTSLAIFIACLGLFGLAAFMAEQRTKEIGVRKVLGASVSGIVFLLSKEFVKWLVMANILAWPAAWYFLDIWLEEFAYRIDLSLLSFALSGVLAMVIALMTVSYQAVRAARTNPVKALKYE